MVDAQEKYIFAQAPNEIGRLQSWARSWEAEEDIAGDPEIFLTSFVDKQVWGRKPETG